MAPEPLKRGLGQDAAIQKHVGQRARECRGADLYCGLLEMNLDGSLKDDEVNPFLFTRPWVVRPNHGQCELLGVELSDTKLAIRRELPLLPPTVPRHQAWLFVDNTTNRH